MKPLERVIAEQQEKIDSLEKRLESQAKSLNTVFTQHQELFELWGKFIDTRPPTLAHKPHEAEIARYADLRHEVRMAMMDAGFCLRCRNFLCECDEE